LSSSSFSSSSSCFARTPQSLRDVTTTITSFLINIVMILFHSLLKSSSITTFNSSGITTFSNQVCAERKLKVGLPSTMSVINR